MYSKGIFGSGLLGSLLLAALVGAGSLVPSAAAAAPPCPECFYPYRACMRQATNPAEQQACADEYNECLQIFCPDPFLSNSLPANGDREQVLASRVERRALLVPDSRR